MSRKTLTVTPRHTRGNGHEAVLLVHAETLRRGRRAYRGLNLPSRGTKDIVRATVRELDMERKGVESSKGGGRGGGVNCVLTSV